MPVSIADALFTKTQQRVLGLLYGKPDQSFYTNEIVRHADMGTGTVRRELDRLTRAGLLRASQTGNQRHYQADPKNPIYQELLGIARKTFGVVDILQAGLQSSLAQIELAFIYGSVAKGEDTAKSDIDLMVIAETLDYADLIEQLMPAEQQLGRPVNLAIYTRGQIQDKLRDKNAFIVRVMDQPKLWVHGGEDDIKGIRESGADQTAQEGAAGPEGD